VDLATFEVRGSPQAELAPLPHQDAPRDVIQRDAALVEIARVLNPGGLSIGDNLTDTETRPA